MLLVLSFGAICPLSLSSPHTILPLPPSSTDTLALAIAVRELGSLMRGTHFQIVTPYPELLEVSLGIW